MGTRLSEAEGHVLRSGCRPTPMRTPQVKRPKNQVVGQFEKLGMSEGSMRLIPPDIPRRPNPLTTVGGNPPFLKNRKSATRHATVIIGAINNWLCFHAFRDSMCGR